MTIEHPLPPMSLPELQARFTNYAEVMAEASRLIQVGDTRAASEMLQAVLGADGELHLKTIRDFEQLIAAVLAFKDRVITQLTKDGCAICGGIAGSHATNCVAAVALSLQPEELPVVEPSAFETLTMLHAHLTRAASEMDAEGRDYLLSAMTACPIPNPK